MDSARYRTSRLPAPIGASYRCLSAECARTWFESALGRRRPDLNRGARICSPLPHHSATAPHEQSSVWAAR